jgi:hypothetical protein
MPEQYFRVFIDGVPRQILPYTEVRTHGVYRIQDGEPSQLMVGSFESPRFWPSSSPGGDMVVLTRFDKLQSPLQLSPEELDAYAWYQIWTKGSVEAAPRSAILLHVPVLSIRDSFGRTIDLPRTTGAIIREERGDTLVIVDGFPSISDSDPDWGP